MTQRNVLLLVGGLVLGFVVGHYLAVIRYSMAETSAIVAEECQGATFQEAENRSAPGSEGKATTKDRFDMCIAMLSAYYDAIEGRLAASVALLVGIIGWLITSDTARRALSSNRWLLILAALIVTLLVLMYGLNIAHWVRRWREIRCYLDELGYMEPKFYARYELPRGALVIYMTPVALLYLFVMASLIMIGSGRLDRGLSSEKVHKKSKVVD